MTTEEYEARADAILTKLGGSYAAPVGWREKGLQFRCSGKPIYIPFPNTLDDFERKVIIEKLEEDFSD